MFESINKQIEKYKNQGYGEKSFLTGVRRYFFTTRKETLSTIKAIQAEQASDEIIFDKLINKTIDLDEAMGGLSETGQKYAEEIRDKKKYVKDYTAAREEEIKVTKAATFQSKASAVALQAVKAALNAAIIFAASAAINSLIKWIVSATQANKEFIETQEDIITTSNDVVKAREDEINELESLRGSLEAVGKNKRELYGISIELSRLTGETVDSIENETGMWDALNQKIQNNIDLKKREIEIEKNRVIEANKEIFKNNTADADFELDIVAQGAGVMLGGKDIKEAVEHIKIIEKELDSFKQFVKPGEEDKFLESPLVKLYNRAIARNKEILKNKAKEAQNYFQVYLDSGVINGQYKPYINRLIEEMVFGGEDDLTNIDKAITKFISSMDIVDKLRTELAKAQVEDQNNTRVSYVKAIGSAAKETQEEIKDLANQYNDLVNGNVDYSKRPFIDPEKMVKAGWEEFLDETINEIATTFDSAFTITDASGKEVMVLVTPILENGEVLSPEELSSYVDNILSGANNILDADAKNKGIVINVDENISIDHLDDLESKLQKIKDIHWGLVKQIYEEANSNKVNPILDQMIKQLETVKKSFPILSELIDDMILEMIKEASSTNIIETAREKISETINNYNNALILLIKAHKEQQANGRLSEKTYNDLIKANTEYIDLLTEENGILKLSTDETQSLINKKYQEAKASMIKYGATAKEILQLKQLNLEHTKEEKTITDLIDELKGLADIYEKVNDKKAISTIEMLGLIEKYPDLITSIRKTSEGYLFEADAINKVIKARTEDLKLIAKTERLNRVANLLRSTPFSKATAENFYNKVMSGEITDASLYTTAHGYIEGLSGYIELLLKEKNLDQVTSDIIADGFLAGASGSEDVWKDAFDASLNALQYERDKDVISEREYLKQLNSLNQTYFANREKYLEEWRQYDVEYYNGMKSIREKDINDYIEHAEDLYKVHQNEMQLINDLQWIFNNWLDISDEQRKTVSEKIKDSQNRVAEKNIEDINHQIEMLQNGIVSYTKLIEKYKLVEIELTNELKRLQELGYDENTSEIQSIQVKIIENQQKINDLTAAHIDNLKREITLIERLDGIKLDMGIEIEYDGKPSQQILDHYEEIMSTAQKRLNELYAQGFDNTNDEVRKYQDFYHDAYQGIVAVHKDAFEKMQEQEEEFNNERIELLEKQIDSLNDIIEQTVKLIKHENEQVIKNLEKQRDSYQQIIDKRKELLQTHRDEEKYNDTITEKQKEIDVKQKRYNALTLNDSRQAQAERMTLEEELADLRKDLEDYQTDYALDKQLQALDDEYEAYADQLDDQISLINDYLTQEGRLREDAMNRLKQSGTELYEQLIDYNKVYGSGIETDITNAWDKAQSALSEYGSVQGGVLNTLTLMNEELENYKNKIESLQKVEFKMSDTGYTLPDYSSYLNGSVENGIINAMKENSNKWLLASSQAERDALHQNNKNLAEKYSQATGNKLSYNSAEGLWYLNGAAIYDLNDLTKMKKYHTGGIVGGLDGIKAIGRNEEMAKLLVGETVLTPNMLDTFTKVTLPNLMSVRPIGGGVNVENMVKVEFGDVTQDVMPEVNRLMNDIPNKVARAMNDLLSGRGYKANAIKFSY